MDELGCNRCKSVKLYLLTALLGLALLALVINRVLLDAAIGKTSREYKIEFHKILYAAGIILM